MIAYSPAITYNPLPDLLIMGALLIGLGLLIKLTSQQKRGATPASDKAVLRHQRKRRGWMLENGGLPAAMNSTFRLKYTVTGNGVAHRSANNYMADPKVKRQIRRIER